MAFEPVGFWPLAYCAFLLGFFVIHSVAPPIAGFTKNIPIFKNPLVQIPLDFFLPRIETKPSALQDICSMKNKNRGCFETFLAL